MYTWAVSALDIPVPLIKWIIVAFGLSNNFFRRDREVQASAEVVRQGVQNWGPLAQVV